MFKQSSCTSFCEQNDILTGEVDWITAFTRKKEQEENLGLAKVTLYMKILNVSPFMHTFFSAFFLSFFFLSFFLSFNNFFVCFVLCRLYVPTFFDPYVLHGAVYWCMVVCVSIHST